MGMGMGGYQIILTKSHIYVKGLLTGVTRLLNAEWTVYWTNGAEETGYPHAKNEDRSSPNTILKRVIHGLDLV